MITKKLRAMKATTCLVLSPLMLCVAFADPVAAADTSADDLLNMSLAELSNIEVTSVSKKAEKETEAAAAIFVITQEDIRRSGAKEIPEVLRMVPGITVTRAGSHDWTVTARGFNGQFSNKLLVLMDGRTLYSPLFSGVIWDMQDTMMEDIDRIEVIRGPGATLWGANAVNGVINIITKNSKDTQGGLAVAAAGNQIKGQGAVRYGMKTGEESHARLYAKRTDHNSEFTPTGGSANDNWNKSQAGFRSDSKLTEQSNLTVQGDIYTIDEDVNYLIPDLNSGTLYSPAEGVKARGANLLSRWEYKQSAESQVSLQVYFDHNLRKTSFFMDEENTVDVDLQQVWTGWEGQEIVWGAGYRNITGRNNPASQQYFTTPGTRNDNLFNAFVQDKFTLVPNEVFFTVGSKFELNDYTGFEVQPSARVSWLPADNQTVWASVSRAVHTPSRFTEIGSLVYANLPPGFVNTQVLATPYAGLDSETMIAYELGYRIQPTKASSIDIAAFYNDYDDLFRDNLGTAIFPVFPGPYAIQPVIAFNDNKAYSMGAEAALKWNVNSDWQLAGGYSYIDLVFKDKDGGLSSSFQGKHPKHQFNARSTYLFPLGVEMNNALYYVDDLGGVGVKGYYRFDTRLAYEIMKGIELSIVGQNLLDNRHQEFTPFVYGYPAEIGRSVYANISFKF